MNKSVAFLIIVAMNSLAFGCAMEQHIDEKEDAGLSAELDVVETYTCEAVLARTSTTTFEYKASVLASGDIQVEASAKNSAGSTRSCNDLMPEHDGYSSGSIVLNGLDLVGPDTTNGWWELELDRSSLFATVRYHDSDLGDIDVQTWVVTPDRCAHKVY